MFYDQHINIYKVTFYDYRGLEEVMEELPVKSVIDHLQLPVGLCRITKNNPLYN